MIPQVTQHTFPADLSSSDPQAARGFLERGRMVEAASARRAELIVTTAEGDRVTLSAAAVASVSYGDHLLRKVGNETLLDIRNRSLTAETAQSFTLLVEGELSKEELEDILRLAGQIRRVVASFTRGQVDRAVSEAMRVAEGFSALDSLAAFGLSVEVREHVVVAEHTRAGLEQPGTAVPKALLDLPMKDAVDTDIDSDGDDDDFDREDDEGSHTPAGLIQALRDAVAEVADRHPRLKGALPQFVREVVRGLHDEEAGHEFHRLERLLRELDERLSGESPPSPHDDEQGRSISRGGPDRTLTLRL